MMAWLQNLAGRAEDLLNKIDQNAANVLNDGNNTKTDDTEDLTEADVMMSELSDVPDKFLPNTSMGLSPKRASPTRASDVVQSGEAPQADVENFIEVPRDIFEKTYKNESVSSKSSSMHNSFVLSEDSQSQVEKITKMELEITDLNKQLLNLQHLYSELRNENATLKTHVDNANYLVATAESEMEQYRARAQRILQEKEQLICLKTENNPSNDSDNSILYNYNEELKKELEFQKVKNQELTDKLDKTAKETLSLQQEVVTMQNTFHQSNEMFERSLADEKRMRQLAEDECRLKTQELNAKLYDLSQQQQIINMKNDEIEHFKQFLKQRTSSGVDDLDSRIRSLTETLMLKQNALETVTTETSALRIQLEKLENEYRNHLAQLQQSQVRIININDTDDVKSQVPQFMRVSPLDAGVTRRVKHAYSTVDAISIKTAVFLRRYPLARVFVFCYMILLQLWAFLVLFWYVPSSR